MTVMMKVKVKQTTQHVTVTHTERYVDVDFHLIALNDYAVSLSPRSSTVFSYLQPIKE